MEPMENFDPEINLILTLECLKHLMMLYDEDGTLYKSLWHSMCSTMSTVTMQLLQLSI